MSDKNLTEENDVHFEGIPKGHAIMLEAKSFEVIKPSITLESDSGLKEQLISEVDVPSTERSQYFSTPVQRQRKSSTIDQQENSLGYKSFFNLECEEIVQQLQSKAVQGWSATKRKLEELDISTIEAEPLPLLCCTPKSVLDEATCSAKRRRIDYQGEGHFSLSSYLTKDKSPVFRISRVQDPKNVHGLNQYRISFQEKSSPQFNSQSHLKCGLSLNTSRTAHSHCYLPANRETSAPEELETEACPSLLCYRKMNFQNHESTTSALEFRSFFAAECEKICNQLKRHNTEMFLSFIEAEPPPDLSATMNSTIILELGSKETSARGVSQLDLEKMNIDNSITERALFLQKATDTGLCNGNETVSKDKVMVTNTAQDSKIDRVVSIANATQDINNEECADGTIRESKMVHWQLPIADTTQDMGTIHDKVTEVDATQGMVMMCKEDSTADPTRIIVKTDENFSPADTPQANMRMSEGESQPCIMQDSIEVHAKVCVANAIHILPMCDASTENDAQGIVEVGDWSATNGTQDNLTFRKMPFPNDLGGTRSTDVSLANATQDIGALCNNVPAVDTTHSNRTVCAAEGTQEMVTTKKLSAVNVTVDIGTTWGTGTDPEKNTNSLQACSKISAQRNTVADDLSVQNVVVNNFQNIVPVDGAMDKTFTCCSLTRHNITHDISVNLGTVKDSPRDLTQLTSYEDASYIPVNVSIIDEKPQINSTQTLMSTCNEVIANDSLQGRGDLTKVMATNCTQLQVCDQPEKQSRHMWPVASLACPFPSRGRMCTMKDTTYNLDLTDIAHDENVFFNRPMSFITSTPLPSVCNHVFIKKPCGLPVKSKPSMYSDHEQDNIIKVMSAQRNPKPQLSVTGQPLGGDPRTRGISKGLLYPSISKSATPKVMESRIPQPSACGTLALSLLKTPQTAKAVVLRKDQMTLGRTNMKPPLAPTGLSRKNMPNRQPGKSASSTLQQQTLASWTGKHIFKKRTDVPKLPASSLVRPPFEFSTPGCQIFAGKVQSIPGPQSAARICKGSSVLPSSVFAGFDPSRNAQQGHTFIRPTNPVGSQISSKIKPFVSGLPARKLQETFLKSTTK